MAAEWAASSGARRVDLQDGGQVLAVLSDYADQGSGRALLSAVLGRAMSSGADHALIEYRYSDADYRAEYRSGYAAAYRRYPPIAHRMHFFRGPLPADLADLGGPAAREYVGYCVLRPVARAPVGRTMIHPGLPDSAADTGLGVVACAVPETVNILGIEHRVVAAPFMSQDGHVGRCAHAVAWQSAYHHHLDLGTARLTPEDIAAAAPELGAGRRAPSAGLYFPQLAAVLSSAGLHPLVYDLTQPLPAGETRDKIACRYLDSGLPVIATAERHTVLLVGYRRREGSFLRKPRLEYVFHDDTVGPYQDGSVQGVRTHQPWTRLIVPMPAKLYLPGESAEQIAVGRLRRMADAGDDAAADIVADLATGAVDLRTVAVRSNVFKRDLLARGLPAAVAGQYRQIPMPRWLWVAEVVDRAQDKSGHPSVLAELIVDGTGHTGDRHVLAWRLPGRLAHWDVDTDEIGTVEVDPVSPLLPLMARRLAAAGLGSPDDA